MAENDIALTDLRVVLAVAECASFTRASHKIGISQPAVSRRVSALERRLGVRLFRRDGQKFFPTEAGITFCSHATEVLDSMEQLENSTVGVSKNPRGSVALGVPPSTGEVLIQDIIPIYRQRYPDVEIRVEQGYLGDLFEMLMNKHVDVALLNGEFSSSDVYLQPLFHHNLGIVYPTAWKQNSPLGGRPMPEQVTIAEAAQLPLYAPSKNQSLRNQIDDAFRTAGVTPNIDAEINSFVLQKSMVLSGHGCMFMSLAAIRDADRDSLAFAPIADASLIYTLYVATRQFGQPTLACKLLTEMIKEYGGSVKNYLNNSALV